MVEKNLKKLQAKKRRVTNGFNTGTRDMRLKTAYRRKKNWSADADQYSFANLLQAGRNHPAFPFFVLLSKQANQDTLLYHYLPFGLLRPLGGAHEMRHTHLCDTHSIYLSPVSR